MLPDISHRNLLLHQAAAEALTRAVHDGGMTFALAADGRITELRPESGYAVGTGGGWVGEASYDALLDALYALQARGRLPGTFGTWLDNGRLYLDPVAIVADRTEALEMARAIGELAIYDFATGESVYTEGAGS